MGSVDSMKQNNRKQEQEMWDFRGGHRGLDPCGT